MLYLRMERITLSSSQILMKIFVAVIALCLLISGLNNNFNIGFLLFAVLVIGFFSYRYFYLPDKIQFDRENMYIIYRNGETAVSLKDVFYVSRSSISTSGLGKIKYR